MSLSTTKYEVIGPLPSKENPQEKWWVSNPYWQELVEYITLGPWKTRAEAEEHARGLNKTMRGWKPSEVTCDH